VNGESEVHSQEKPKPVEDLVKTQRTLQPVSPRKQTSVGGGEESALDVMTKNGTREKSDLKTKRNAQSQICLEGFHIPFSHRGEGGMGGS